MPALGSLRIQGATVEQIEIAAARWAKAASTKEANKILRTLTAIFKLAQRYGPLQSKANAAELAERLKVSNEENEDEEVLPDQVYSEEELKKLVNTTEQGSFERALVMVPGLTGMRIGEVLGLTWPGSRLQSRSDQRTAKFGCFKQQRRLGIESAEIKKEPTHVRYAARTGA